jgi:serine/threonine-protein phosphatase PGAM5
MNRTSPLVLCALLALLAGIAAAAAQAPVPTRTAAPTADPAAPMREVVLVRHGHYTADPAIDERVGPGLSALGVAQARLVGARLRSDLVRLDGLHVSPMQRARDTAAAIGGGFRGRVFQTLDDLAECTPPTRRAEVMAGEAPESTAACRAQLERLFATIFDPAQPAGRTDLYVCHGNVIRYLVTRALGVDTEAWLEMSVGHASITRIRIEPDGRFKVIAVGDVGHLPATLRTGASGDRDTGLAVEPLPVAAPTAVTAPGAVDQAPSKAPRRGRGRAGCLSRRRPRPASPPRRT